MCNPILIKSSGHLFVWLFTKIVVFNGLFESKTLINMLIGSDMRDSSENANAFPSCVGAFGEALQSPAGATGQLRRKNDP